MRQKSSIKLAKRIKTEAYNVLIKRIQILAQIHRIDLKRHDRHHDVIDETYLLFVAAPAAQKHVVLGMAGLDVGDVRAFRLNFAFVNNGCDLAIRN